MKIFIVAFLAFTLSPVFSQELKLTIADDYNSLTVFPEENNDSVFVINTATSLKNKFLSIKIDNEIIPGDWKRSFFIYDQNDSTIRDFDLMKDKSFCLKICKLKSLLKPGEDYFIYTIALPRDPQKAMAIRVARLLVCKLKIR